MAKILLVSCNMATSPYPVFPLGMAYVASALQGQGHQVRQVDIQATGLTPFDTLKAHIDFMPDLVGLSIRNIDSTDSHQGISQWYLDKAKDITHTVRSLYPAPIVIGGAGVALMAEEIRNHTGANFAIVGEGEKAMHLLVQSLEKNQWRTSGLPALWRAESLAGDEIVCPMVDSQIANFYLDKSGVMGIQSKRGCPYHCAYCSYPTIEGRSLRYANPEGIAGHMEKMYTDFQVSEFVFCDSVFNDSRGYFLDLAKAIKKCNIPVRWSGYFRPSATTVEELSFLQSAGLYALEIGTDSASDVTLEAMKKPFSFSEVQRFSASCADLGLAQAHFIIMGGPKETLQTAREGLKNIQTLEKSVVFVYQGVRILPHTHIEQLALKEGVISPSTSLLRPVYYHSADITPESLQKMIEDDFAGDMTRIFPPAKGSQMESALRALGHKGLLWDKLLISRRKNRKRNKAIPSHV